MFPKNHATGFNHWDDMYSGNSQQPQPTKSSKTSTKTTPTSATTNTTKKTAPVKVDENIKTQKMSINITKSDLERIPENINFPNEEERILQYWKDEKVFENCLKQSKGKPR